MKRKLINGMLVDQPEMEMPDATKILDPSPSGSDYEVLDELMDKYNEQLANCKKYLIDGDASRLPDEPIEGKDYVIDDCCNCGGSGMITITRSVCCQKPNRDGSCCGNAEPDQAYDQCEYCTEGEVARVITQPSVSAENEPAEDKGITYMVINNSYPYCIGQKITAIDKKDQEYFNDKPHIFYPQPKEETQNGMLKQVCIICEDSETRESAIRRLKQLFHITKINQ